jgi:hypothetical protein
MNVLYGGKYKDRFQPVTTEIAKLPLSSIVLELCFGDTHVASFCKQKGYRWIGFDINSHFIFQAQKHGFNAQYGDVLTIQTLPKADVCVMIGSFYHFHRNADSILSKMVQAAPLIIFSEPVSNLSSKKGILGFIARRAANAGHGEEGFRYTRETFLKFITEARERLKFTVLETNQSNRDLIIKIKRYEAA